MTYHDHSLLCEKNSQYPYKTKYRAVAGEDHVDFIYQFVKNSNARVKEYTTREEFITEMDTCQKIIGQPTTFPYEDKLFTETETLVMRLDNFNISISPWQKEPYLPCTLCPYYYYRNTPQDEGTIHFNYIDLEFHKAVYPIRVSIYEVYNPGFVTQILAQDSDKCWFELWTGQPQNISSETRIFSPPLQFCDFKTKILRLKFISSYMHCSIHLDAVELIGTSKLILPKNPKQSLTNLLKSTNCNFIWLPCHKDIHNLTPYNENAHLDIFNLQEGFQKYCIICKSDIAQSNYKQVHREDVPCLERGCMKHDYPNYPNYPNFTKLIKDIDLYWHESKEQPRCSFSALPDDIVIRILKNLDLKSLCHMNQTSRRFYDLTRDRSLITSLNLRHMRHMDSICIDNIISYLALRCESLQQLDLTSSNISSVYSHFENFLNICGWHLTHLRLRKCQFDNSALLQISRICKNLKVLDLGYIYNEDVDEGFLSLENLEFLDLENLNLRFTSIITAKSLCKILQKNRRMRKLDLNHLNIQWEEFALLDTVAIQLGDSCPDLEVIDLTGNTITSRGIVALAECKNLRKLNISYINASDESYTIDRSSLRRLFSSCQLLEEVNLIGANNMSDIVEELTLCKNLKQVYLDIPENGSLKFFDQCSKLQTVYVDDVYGQQGHTRRTFVDQMKEKKPGLCIPYKWDNIDYEYEDCANYGWSE